MSVDIAQLGLSVDNTTGLLKMEQFGRGMTDLGTKGDSLIGKMKGVAASLGIAFGAGAIVHKFIEETSSAQFAMAQLEAVIRSTGGAAGKTVGELQATATALQRVTTFSDDAVQGAQSLLLTFTQIRGANFDRATAAVADLAAAMGTDLKGASIQVGKALNDPVQGITALTRVGVSFSDAQKLVIKNLAETNRVAEAQALILKELETEFGGSAAAARNTLGGALAGLKNTFGDLFEVSGDNTKGLVSSINALTDALEKLNSSGAIGSIGQGFAQIVREAAALPELLHGIGAELSASFELTRAILSGSVAAYAVARAQMETAIGRVDETLAKLQRQKAQAAIGFIGPTAPGRAGAPNMGGGSSAERDKELADLKTANELRVRSAQQALAMASLIGEAAERQSVLDKAINEEYKIRATLRKEDQAAALASVATARDLGLQEVKVTAEIRERERMKAVAWENEKLRIADVAAKEIAYNDDIAKRIQAGGVAILAKLDKQAFALANMPKPPVQDAIDWAATLQSVVGIVQLIASAFGDVGKEVAAIALGAQSIVSGLRQASGIKGGFGNALSGKSGGSAQLEALGAAGAVAGGVLALADAVDLFGTKAKAAEEATRQLVAQYNQQLRAITLLVNGASALDLAINQVRDQFAQLRAEAIAQDRARGGFKGGVTTELDRVNKLEEERIRQLEKEAAAVQEANRVEQARATEDLAVRSLRARGLDAEADAMAFANTQSRELADAIAKYGEGAYADALRLVLAEEAAKRAADALAEAILKAAEAMEAARRTTEGLLGRGLAATGGGRAAEDAATFHSQRQEFADAIKAGMSPSNLALLAFTQMLEREQIALQRAIEDGTKAINARADADIAAVDAQISAIQKASDLEQKAFDQAIDDAKANAEKIAAAFDVQIQGVRNNLKAQNDAFDAQAKIAHEQLDAAHDAVSALQSIVNNTQKAFEALSGFRGANALSDLSTLSPVQKEAEARRQFDALAASARGGSADAASQLPAAAQALLAISRANNASSAAFAAESERVNAIMDALAKQFGATLANAQGSLSGAQGAVTLAEQQLQAISDAKEAANAAADAQIELLQAAKEQAAKDAKDQIDALNLFKEAALQGVRDQIAKLEEQKLAIRAAADAEIAALTASLTEASQARIAASEYYATYQRLQKEDADARDKFYEDSRSYYERTAPRTPPELPGTTRDAGNADTLAELKTQNVELKRQTKVMADGMIELRDEIAALTGPLTDVVKYVKRTAEAVA